MAPLLNGLDLEVAFPLAQQNTTAEAALETFLLEHSHLPVNIALWDDLFPV